MSVAMSHGMRDAQRFETISEQCLWQWLTEYLTCMYKYVYYQSSFIMYIYIICYIYKYVYIYCIYIYMYHEDGSDYQWTPLNRVAPRINIGELSKRQNYTCSLPRLGCPRVGRAGRRGHRWGRGEPGLKKSAPEVSVERGIPPKNMGISMIFMGFYGTFKKLTAEFPA